MVSDHEKIQGSHQFDRLVLVAGDGLAASESVRLLGADLVVAGHVGIEREVGVDVGITPVKVFREVAIGIG